MANLDLISLDPQEILDTLKTAYYNQYGEQIQIGSDAFATASAQAYAWTILLNSLNEATRNRFISTSTGAYLDAIAANYGITERPSGYSATIQVRFTWYAHGGTPPSYIPANSIRIQHGDGVFYNRYPLPVFVGGEIHRDQVLYCEEAGTRFNNIPASAESQILEGTYYVASYTVLTMSDGGTDGFPHTEEGDDSYREWLKTEIQSFAGAGTYLAYEAKAKNADIRVKDVYVLKQTDDGYEKGKVKIFVYSDDGSGYVTSIVQTVCSDPAFRPVGDLVEAVDSGTDNLNILNKIQTTYPPQFRASCAARNLRIITDYRAELLGKINAPFCFAELCRRLIEKDGDGVYCNDAKPIGVTMSAYLTPIYPTLGNRISINLNVFQFDVQIGGV